MNTETQKPWEMNQKEYEQWYQDNMGEKDNIPYSERVSQWKKQGKLTLILGKPTTLDKSANSSIMTSNKGDEDDNNRRHETDGLRTENKGQDVRGTDSHSRVETNEPEGAERTADSQSTSGEEHSRELHSDRDGAVHGVAEGNPGRDTGEGQRLTPKPEPNGY